MQIRCLHIMNQSDLNITQIEYKEQFRLDLQIILQRIDLNFLKTYKKKMSENYLMN